MVIQSTHDNLPYIDMFFGDYEDNNQDPSMWFPKFQHMLLLSWTDTQKINHFKNHIVPTVLCKNGLMT